MNSIIEKDPVLFKQLEELADRFEISLTSNTIAKVACDIATLFEDENAITEEEKSVVAARINTISSYGRYAQLLVDKMIVASEKLYNKDSWMIQDVASFVYDIATYTVKKVFKHLYTLYSLAQEKEMTMGVSSIIYSKMMELCDIVIRKTGLLKRISDFCYNTSKDNEFPQIIICEYESEQDDNSAKAVITEDENTKGAETDSDAKA